jgi:hypothetical protein
MARHTRNSSARRRAAWTTSCRARHGLTLAAAVALAAVTLAGVVGPGSLVGAGPATAAAPTSGWTAGATAAPTGPDTPG